MPYNYQYLPEQFRDKPVEELSQILSRIAKIYNQKLGDDYHADLKTEEDVDNFYKIILLMSFMSAQMEEEEQEEEEEQVVNNFHKINFLMSFMSEQMEEEEEEQEEQKKYRPSVLRFSSYMPCKKNATEIWNNLSKNEKLEHSNYFNFVSSNCKKYRGLNLKPKKIYIRKSTPCSILKQNYTVKQLKQEAKKYKLRGYSRMNKNELCNLITKNYYESLD
jgi:hypothetical protein